MFLQLKILRLVAQELRIHGTLFFVSPKDADSM